MPVPTVFLSDGGLIRGSYVVTINGYTYVLKTFDLDKPVRSENDYSETGAFNKSSHITDAQKWSVTISAVSGTPEPTQLFPFTISAYAGLYWAVGNVKLTGSAMGLQLYSGDLMQLATSNAARTTS